MVEERRGWKGRERPGVKTTPGRHSASAASCRPGGTRAPLLRPLLWELALISEQRPRPQHSIVLGRGGTGQTALSWAGCPKPGAANLQPSPLTTPCSMLTS